ncbi:MAG: DUF2336 domain-containing protein [Rhodospirillaceae bacterium]|jgi:uncharacterized protein (DUF2336 family)|nr:DUF2336 domain-containing protein [Rhodospirillaceae bacterium]MBT5458034.1 DUF2336 domain-containing protein [Rhodospirillaceae bacterium]
MSGLFARLAGRGSSGAKLDYDKAKELASAQSPEARRELAGRADAQPEILYFLAEDSDVDVRRTVAGNQATPPHAGVRLATDDDIEVRCTLAQQIGRLAPELDDAAREKVGAIVNEVLDILAQDQVARVRAVLSETLKETENVPADLIRRLANDAAIEVASPVLEFSPVLDDEFLREIIQNSPASEILSSISRRNALDPSVSDAVVGTRDEQAIAALLSNKSAQIREETLDQLVDQAERVPQWHQPLVDRPALSSGAITRLADFVTDSMLADLEKRHDIDSDLAEALATAMKSRLRDKSLVDLDADPDEISDRDDREEAPEDRALRLHKSGKLTEDSVTDALDIGDRPFVIQALALLGEISADAVSKAVSMSSSKGITALAWNAGLGMRTAVQLQLRLARVPPAKILQARNGVDYPLSEDEMNWQIDFFGG